MATLVVFLNFIVSNSDRRGDECSQLLLRNLIAQLSLKHVKAAVPRLDDFLITLLAYKLSGSIFGLREAPIGYFLVASRQPQSSRFLGHEPGSNQPLNKAPDRK